MLNRVRYDNQDNASNRSYCLPSLFAALDTVLLTARQWIAKHADRVLKTEMVLLTIGFVLCFIPFKDHKKSIFL